MWPRDLISQLNTLPACAPVNASMAASRLATHDSGSGWFATPFLCDSFIHNSTPVYPGALRILLSLRGLFGIPLRLFTACEAAQADTLSCCHSGFRLKSAAL